MKCLIKQAKLYHPFGVWPFINLFTIIILPRRGCSENNCQIHEREEKHKYNLYHFN